MPLKSDVPCVLFVDDEPTIRKAGQRILTRAGCRVYLAANGQEALEIYSRQRHEIDVVIMDLGMPVMDGLTCLSALRQMDPNARVILSSGSHRSETSKALENGAIGVLPKPYGANDLINVFKKGVSSSLQ